MFCFGKDKQELADLRVRASNAAHELTVAQLQRDAEKRTRIAAEDTIRQLQGEVRQLRAEQRSASVQIVQLEAV